MTDESVSQVLFCFNANFNSSIQTIAVLIKCTMQNEYFDINQISENTFSTLTKESLLPVYWLNKSGAIIYVNKAVTDYMEYSKDELLQLKVTDVDLHADDKDALRVFNLIKEKKIVKFESQHVTKSGKIVDVEVVGHYFVLNSQEVLFSYIFDITDRNRVREQLLQKTNELEEINRNLEETVRERTSDLEAKIRQLEETEAKLRTNEEIFSNAFKTSEDSINLNSIKNGTYLLVSEGFTKIMGYTAEEAVGQSSLKLNVWKNPADRARLTEGLLRDGFYKNLEADFVRKDGTVIRGLMSASIQKYKGEDVILSVSKDITWQKKLEDELKELNNNLQKRVEEEVELRQKQESLLFEQRKFADMGQMINAIAHQWRQPLNALGLIIQNVIDDYKQGDINNDTIDYFETKSLNLISFLSETIDQFRTFFKTSKEAEDFSLLDTIYDVTSLIDAQLKEKHVDLSVTCTTETDSVTFKDIKEIKDFNNFTTTISGFKGELKQVLLNLIYNSVDAIESHKTEGNSFYGKLFLCLYFDAENVHISLSDNGCGIPEQVKNRIFEPFFTTKSLNQGTGIGLYMSKLIIENHFRGSISAENNDSGATFKIRIPLSNNTNKA